MPGWIFFANQAEPEDQGGFCDTDSKIHYCNESKDETLNRAAIAEEHGGQSDIRYDYDAGEPENLPADTRFNTTILEVDDQGFEYPAKYGPGR
jgi:hypothetical protein